jgi:hypothetical protein
MEQTEGRDDPNELTLEKLLARKAQWDADVQALKADEALNGFCICANCFGDRLWLAWRGSVERRQCLSEPGRLTDLGEGIGRDLLR